MTPVDLKGLSAVAKKLNQETDALNDVIDSLEIELGKMKLGVSAWTDTILGRRDWAEEQEGSNDWEKYPVYRSSGFELGYAKVGETWVIAVRYVEGHGTDREEMTWSDGEPTALRSAPRNIRVEAAAHLEELVTAIQRRAEQFIRDIERAKELLK